MTQPNGNYQFEIYFQGLLGELPALPMAFHELEVRAAQALPPSVWSYVRAGAGDEHTQNAQRLRLQPVGPAAPQASSSC
jgi:lactate 2-monooxygenase